MPYNPNVQNAWNKFFTLAPSIPIIYYKDYEFPVHQLANLDFYNFLLIYYSEDKITSEGDLILDDDDLKKYDDIVKEFYGE